MKALLAILSLLAIALVIPAMAAKKDKAPEQPAAPELKIVEVDAVSIRVTLGLSGNEHVDYRITDQTKITLNGAPVAARDLRPGMVAEIQAGPDKVATSITAKDAPAHPGRHRVGWRQQQFDQPKVTEGGHNAIPLKIIDLLEVALAGATIPSRPT